MASLTSLRKYRLHIVLYLTVFLPQLWGNLPEQGKFVLKFQKGHEYHAIRRTVYADTSIHMKIECDLPADKTFKISWVIRSTGCYEEYGNNQEENVSEMYYNYPKKHPVKSLPSYSAYIQECKSNAPYDCFGKNVDECMADFKEYFITKPNVTATNAPVAQAQHKVNIQDEEGVERQRRAGGIPLAGKGVVTNDKDNKTGNNNPSQNEVGDHQNGVDDGGKTTTNHDAKTTKKKTTIAVPHTTKKVTTSNVGGAQQNGVGDGGTTTTNHDAKTTKKKTTITVPHTTKKRENGTFIISRISISGVYLMVIHVRYKRGSTVNLTLEFISESHRFISPLDYPLIITYGLLCAIYILFAIAWLILLALNWKDILRLQYWIAAVIFLGMLEKALFLSEYDSVYRTGVSASSVAMFAAFVSCLKRTVARLLLIIASVGFGIVKPRLGPRLKKVLAVGALYLTLACVEEFYTATLPRVNTSTKRVYPYVCVVVLDAAICWWIYSNLIKTMRTLKIRKNIVKHSVYRHFSRLLIFAVLASITYIVYWMVARIMYDCIKDYSTYWLDEAFWPMLFCVVLLVIIILWRPTTSNQRYAFSPLLDRAEDDDGDDDENEIVLNDVYEGIKLRNIKEEVPKKDPQTKVDIDLKWVKDNIPASIADKILVSLGLDNALKQTRLETEKMG